MNNVDKLWITSDIPQTLRKKMNHMNLYEGEIFG